MTSGAQVQALRCLQTQLQPWPKSFSASSFNCKRWTKWLMGNYHVQSDGWLLSNNSSISPGYLLSGVSFLSLAFRLLWRLIMSSLFLGVITSVVTPWGGEVVILSQFIYVLQNFIMSRRKVREASVFSQVTTSPSDDDQVILWKAAQADDVCRCSHR